MDDGGPDPGETRGGEVAVRATRDADALREAALVLAAEGLPARVARGKGRLELLVPASEHEAAERALAAYARENRAARAEERERPAAPPRAATGPRGATALGVGLGAAILLSFAALGPAQSASRVAAAASAQAGRIQAGEIARAVTALGLHADAGHALGNALAGGLFVALLARRLGAGLAFALALAAGALGNLANALLRDAGHDSVGASTAVFGMVGLLAALAAAEGAPRLRRMRSPLVPVGAGLALLAFLGGGGVRVDLGAHLAGFAAGLALGLAAARRRAPVPLQLAAALAALVTLAAAWARVLA